MHLVLYNGGMSFVCITFSAWCEILELLKVLGNSEQKSHHESNLVCWKSDDIETSEDKD